MKRAIDRSVLAVRLGLLLDAELRKVGAGEDVAVLATTTLAASRAVTAGMSREELLRGVGLSFDACYDTEMTMRAAAQGKPS